MRFVCGLLLVLSVLVLFACVSAKPTISTTISSNMLFQRDAANCIWGSFGNTTVTVTLINNNTEVAEAHRVFTFTNTTQSNGTFEVWIPASVYTYYGYYNFTIQISDVAPGVITLVNVIYGELWLCSGQSNMDLSAGSTFDYPMLLNETRSTILRLFKTPNINSTTPLDYVTTSGWYPATSMALFPYFQAVCYAFGREMVRKTGIPVGLIGTSWGGTYIEAWSSPAALANCPRFDKSNFTGVDNNAPSELYNGKLYPYRRFSVNGFLWYQGEQNLGHAQLYGCQLPALIEDMRSLFHGSSQAPFGFVQLTAINTSSVVAAEPFYYQMRYDMVNGTQNTPHVYYTTGIDLGDLESPYGTIHSRNKTLLGQRLFNTIGHDYYNQTSTPSFGPTVQSCCNTFNNATNITTYEVTFAGTDSLVQLATPYCTSCCSISPFDVLVKNSAGQLARVMVNNTYFLGNKAIFSLYTKFIPVGYNVTQVRYAAYDFPECLVYNPVNVRLLIAPQFNVSCPATCQVSAATTTTTAKLSTTGSAPSSTSAASTSPSVTPTPAPTSTTTTAESYTSASPADSTSTTGVSPINPSSDSAMHTYSTTLVVVVLLALAFF